MKKDKKCKHDYRQIMNAQKIGKHNYDISIEEVRFYYVFYCTRCLFLDYIEKTNETDLTD